MSATFVPRECPYVGLEPFQPAYAAYFFGRRFDSRVLADHVRSRRTTVLFGASGVGKSSVINVGLPAALATGAPWTIVCLRNWQNLEDLEQAAVDAIIEALAPEERMMVLDALATFPRRGRAVVVLRYWEAGPPMAPARHRVTLARDGER